MTVSILRSSAALAFIFAAGAAHADLTAKDVWADWRDYMSSSGYEVTAGEAMSGSTLTLTDVTLNLTIPEEDASIRVVVPKLDLTENGDGSVSATYPSPMPLKVGFVEDGEQVGSGELVLTHAGMSVQVTGSTDDLTYTTSADEITMTLANMMAEGQPVPEGIARAVITITALAGTSRMTKGNLRQFQQSYTMGGLTYDAGFDDPTSDDKGAFKGGVQGFSMEASGALPIGMAAAELPDMVAAGFEVDAKMTYTGGSSDIQGTADGENFSLQSTSAGGNFHVGMSKTQISYGLGSKGLSVNVAGAELPFPVSFTTDDIGFDFALPVSKSDVPQDFALGVRLREFNTTEMIWGLADPGGVLPHDPVSLVVDLAGKVKLFADLMDEQAMMSFGQGLPPGELHEVTIKSLLAKAIGAQLTGMGAFTIDNTQSFNGMPKPTGAIELTLDGANALLDNLIAMGIVSDQDAMGARMMMGMLAVPGDGPDQLKSKIEINEAGHVLANGQRIQ